MDFKIPEGLPNMNIDRFLNDPREREWSEPFTFVLGADPQFGMIGNCKFADSVETWDAEMHLMREAIHKVNHLRPKPKFFLFCGDMLDALPFTRDQLPMNHPKIHDISVRDKQYKDFIKVLHNLDKDIKPVFVSGNHDVGDIPTLETIDKYRKEFGSDYFTFWCGGVKFVVLNSQYFYSPAAVPEETERQQRFIEENIKDEGAKHIVVFQHIPFFGTCPEEEDIYCNIPKERRLPLLERYHNLGVRYIFCGHYHRNSGGMYKDMELVITSAMGAPFGDDPSGFRIVTVDKDKIKHEYVKLRDTTDCTPFEAEYLYKKALLKEMKEDKNKETKDKNSNEADITRLPALVQAQIENQIQNQNQVLPYQPNYKVIEDEEMEDVPLLNHRRKLEQERPSRFRRPHFSRR